MFDVKQCEADGWKCEVTSEDGQRSHLCEYRGVHRTGAILVFDHQGEERIVEPDEVRNIAKPKVKRWNGDTYIKSINIGGQLSDVFVAVPLIEDSAGIRVDHSDAVIEALEDVRGFFMRPYDNNVIDTAIAKIKKDRGE